MNLKAIRWLYDELPDLVEGGVLDEGAAARLRGHYGELPGPGRRANLLIVVLGTLGALLVGGGITLLFAHNWEELSRPVRAGLSFAMLVGAQGLCCWVLLAKRGSRAWCEGASLFLALAVVTAMSLISQTYNLPGDVETLLFVWMLLVIPLVYLFESRSTAALVWIGSTMWLMSGPWWDDSLMRPLWLLVLVGSTVPFLLRLATRHRDEFGTPLLGWAVGGSLLVAGIRLVSHLGGDVWVVFYAGLLGALYAVHSWLSRADGVERPVWCRPLHSLGAVGLGVLFFFLSFSDVWGEGWQGRSDRLETLAAMIGAGLIMTGVSTLGAIDLAKRRRVHQALVAALPLVAVVSWTVAQFLEAPGYATALVNLAALGTGVAVCVHGVSAGRLGTANGGLVFVLVILVARFFDADLSFVARGIGFIVLGGSLLGVNLLIVRRRRKEAS